MGLPIQVHVPDVSARPQPRKRCCARCTRMPFNSTCGRPGCGCHTPKLPKTLGLDGDDKETTND